jgi:hypothetical protein
MKVTDKEAAAKPAGSADESRIVRKDWTAGLGSKDVAQVHAFGKELAETYGKEIKSHVKFRIKMGSLLNEVRALIPGDKEFGQWRKMWSEENMPHVSPNTLGVMMNMAKTFRNSTDFLEKAGWSVGQELLSSPPVVWNKVKELVEDGEPPTRKEVQEIKREAKPAPVTIDEPAAVEPKQDFSAPLPPEDKRAEVIIANSDIEVRMELLAADEGMHEFTKAWALVRMPAPNGDEYKYATDIIFDHYIEAYADSAEVVKALQEACSLVGDQ